jgi:kumamolisin
MANKTHVKLSGSKRSRSDTAFRIGEVDPQKKVIVTIRLSGPELPGPDEFVGQTMTPEELREKFGAKKEDADKVEKCLKKFGLKVEEVLLDTRSMRVSGPAEAMKAAFKPDWAMMRSPTYGVYRGRKGEYGIPAELKGIVTGVFGLDERRMAHRRSSGAVSVGARTTKRPLTPADIERRYNFPEGDGEGQTIAIAEFGGGYFENDLIDYCKRSRRQKPHVRPIEVGRGHAYTFDELLGIQDPDLRHLTLDHSFEVMMDVEIIAGLCPKANISVYFSTFDQAGWVDLLTKVIYADPVPVALSISWGRAEDDIQWAKGAVIAINDLLNQVSRKGITICVASGDDGARDEVDDGEAHVDFPASSPYVMGVGGTMLKQSGEEVTWWEDPGTAAVRAGATGGGVSRVFTPRPAWQKVASGNRGSKKGRMVPDVSALAGEPYYSLVFAGFPWSDGQTSASAPVWAALIARIDAKLPPNKRQRFLTPLLYQKLPNGKRVGEASFRDITSFGNIKLGRNVFYPPRPGFDFMTGWGVPDGKKLLKCLAQI